MTLNRTNVELKLEDLSFLWVGQFSQSYQRGIETTALACLT